MALDAKSEVQQAARLRFLFSTLTEPPRTHAAENVAGIQTRSAKENGSREERTVRMSVPEMAAIHGRPLALEDELASDQVRSEIGF